MPVPGASNRPAEDVSSAERPDVRGLSLDELAIAIIAAGQPPYRARQVMHWLHAKHAESFDAMHDLPADYRGWLAAHFTIGSLQTASVARSSDGTRKLLLRLRGGNAIETVIIPASGRVTLCLSTQAGCAMACEFCATARMGLHRNLTTAEIIGQIHAARRELAPGETLTNYVFMGMGEPLANYPRLVRALEIMTEAWGMDISPRRIKHPSEALKKGERIEAVILNIDVENHRLSLGIKQLQPDVWEQFFTNHHIGSMVRGRIVRHAPFGVFVELDEGIEGLCHVSEVDEADRTKMEERFKAGEESEFKIIKLSPNERKIGLSHRALAEDAERKEYDSYRDSADGGATLADLFHAKDNS